MGASDEFDKGPSSCDERFGIETLAPRGRVVGAPCEFRQGLRLIGIVESSYREECPSVTWSVRYRSEDRAPF